MGGCRLERHQIESQYAAIERKPKQCLALSPLAYWTQRLAC